MMLNALQNIVVRLKASQTFFDTEFEGLEELLRTVCEEEEIYSDEQKNKIASLLVNDLTVKQPINQIRQVWIATTFKPEGFKLKSLKNPFKDFYGEDT